MTKQFLAIWSLVLLPFLNPGFTSGCSQFMYCWSLPWRILSITLLACLHILSMQILTFFLVLLCSYSVFSVVWLRFKINFLLLSLVLACTLLERSSILYKLWEVMQRLEWEWIGRRNCCQPLVPGGWAAKGPKFVHYCISWECVDCVWICGSLETQYPHPMWVREWW